MIQKLYVHLHLVEQMCLQLLSKSFLNMSGCDKLSYLTGKGRSIHHPEGPRLGGGPAAPDRTPPHLSDGAAPHLRARVVRHRQGGAGGLGAAGPGDGHGGAAVLPH